MSLSVVGVAILGVGVWLPDLSCVFLPVKPSQRGGVKS